MKLNIFSTLSKYPETVKWYVILFVLFIMAWLTNTLGFLVMGLSIDFLMNVYDKEKLKNKEK